MTLATDRLSALCFARLEGDAESMAVCSSSFSQEPVRVCAMEPEAVFPGKRSVLDHIEGAEC